MDVGTPLVADRQPSELAEPGQGALHDPPVPSQPGSSRCRAVRSGAGCRGGSGPCGSAVIVGLIGMQLAGSPTGPAPGRRHDIDHLLQRHAVMRVRACQADRERDAVGIGKDMALRPRLAPVGRVWPRLRAPLFAATDALSRAARRKSMALRRPRRSRTARWRRPHTPASRQSLSRRQHVMPDPQPISWGSISHGIPECSTKRMPVRTARSGSEDGRPSVSAAQAATAAPPPPKAHRGQGACSCHPARAIPGFVRCSKSGHGEVAADSPGCIKQSFKMHRHGGQGSRLPLCHSADEGGWQPVETLAAMPDQVSQKHRGTRPPARNTVGPGPGFGSFQAA